MRRAHLVGLSLIAISVASGAQAATISEVVNGPDGTHFRAAFVQAQNTKTKITISVLSQNDGTYRIKNLPAGEYDVSVRAVGFENDQAARTDLSNDASLDKNFALKKGKVSWSDLSYEQ